MERHTVSRASGIVLLALLFSCIPTSCSAATWYDGNTSDDKVWTHRIPVRFTDTSNSGRPFPVSIPLGRLFSGILNYSSISMSSLRVVDPDIESGAVSVGGTVVRHQLDYCNETYVGALCELSFIAEVPALGTKTYYVYYSVDDSIPPAVYATDLEVSFQESVVNVVNNRAAFEGFKNGYFGLHEYKNSVYGSNIAYPNLGLDYGFSVDSASGKEDFLRYDRFWNCYLMNKGPVRSQVKCNATSENYTVAKVFSFYSGLPYYVSLNTLEVRNIAKTQVSWDVYSVLKPYFSRESGSFWEYEEGIEDAKSSYVIARYVSGGEPRNYVFMMASRGDAKCAFLEDRLEDYDLFSVSISARNNRKVSAETIYLFSVGGFDYARDEFLRFKAPPRQDILGIESNRIEIVNPSPLVFYDALLNESAIIPIEAANLQASTSVKCSVSNPYGDVVYPDVPLYNDGSHGDATAGDTTWTNGRVHVLGAGDVTGLWTVNCTEEGSHSVSTTASGSFAVTHNYNYRRITLCGDTERQVKIRPGETLELDFCVENTGGGNETIVGISAEGMPAGWSASSLNSTDLLRGGRSTVRMALSIPLDQALTYERIRLDVMGNGVVRGVGWLRVEVVVPILDIHAESYDGTYGVHVVNERGGDIQGALVEVTYPSGVERGETDINGRYVLSRSEAGAIRVRVSKEGYSATEIRLAVDRVESGEYAYLLAILALITIAIVYVRSVRTIKRGAV
ncbi:MAG: carboxypeptidase-like regulatory domain-containing protein [Candidatus Altiarchaeota archaeon]|nr:carboxypeptidase-like regulatory domain-containing protein [Candidatus Altiarchaeota archaeon]